MQPSGPPSARPGSQQPRQRLLRADFSRCACPWGSPWLPDCKSSGAVFAFLAEELAWKHVCGEWELFLS